MQHPDDSKITIIGIGNEFRGDDAAGLIVARLLRDGGLGPVTLLEHSGEGADLMEAWKGPDAVILIDAVNSGAPPGTIHRFEPLHAALPAALLRHSTHAFSLPQAIELARALRQLPARLVLFGIEGRDFRAGTELSAEVSRSLALAVRRIREEVEGWESRSL